MRFLSSFFLFISVLTLCCVFPIIIPFALAAFFWLLAERNQQKKYDKFIASRFQSSTVQKHSNRLSIGKAVLRVFW